jgi:hypothetical protein
MQLSLILVSLAAFVVIGFAFVGGPIVLADWSRKRSQGVADRQMALTEALDGQLGPIVAPVVTKPLFGPWEVQIAVPFQRPAMLARIVSVVDDVFFRFEGRSGRSYRMLLSAKPDCLAEASHRRTRRLAKRWASNPIAAA